MYSAIIFFLYVATRLCQSLDNRTTIGIPLILLLVTVPYNLIMSYDHKRQSSRTRQGITRNSQSLTVDRDQTVSRRFKPSSRTTLMGEQPNPWNRLQLQDVMSRHRGAKRFRR